MRNSCFFVSDLHGRKARYEKLFEAILRDRPQLVFLGGDLLPSFGSFAENEFYDDFLHDYLRVHLRSLRDTLGASYPKIFFVFGNDDPKTEEDAAMELEQQELWFYAHNTWTDVGEYQVCGYAYVPPTPFRLKDWERYDVSRYVDPGCIAPEDGAHSIPVAESLLRHATIQQDLQQLTGNMDVSRSVFLFHSPPHKTNLDRAALDGKKIDHAPLDVHVGSIAIRRFIEQRQPLLTLHGHIHESARIMGSWRDRIGKTQLFSGANDTPELALVRFELENLESATRELL